MPWRGGYSVVLKELEFPSGVIFQMSLITLRLVADIGAIDVIFVNRQLIAHALPLRLDGTQESLPLASSSKCSRSENNFPCIETMPLAGEPCGRWNRTVQ